MWWLMLLAVSSSSYLLSSCGSYPTRYLPRWALLSTYSIFRRKKRKVYLLICQMAKTSGPSNYSSLIEKCDLKTQCVTYILVPFVTDQYGRCVDLNQSISQVYVDLINASDQSICQVCWSESINMAGMLTPGFHWCWFFWSSSQSGRFSSSRPLFCFRLNLMSCISCLFLIWILEWRCTVLSNSYLITTEHWHSVLSVISQCETSRQPWANSLARRLGFPGFLLITSWFLLFVAHTGMQ